MLIWSQSLHSCDQQMEAGSRRYTHTRPIMSQSLYIWTNEENLNHILDLIYLTCTLRRDLWAILHAVTRWQPRQSWLDLWGAVMSSVFIYSRGLEVTEGHRGWGGVDVQDYKVPPVVATHQSYWSLACLSSKPLTIRWTTIYLYTQCSKVW